MTLRRKASDFLWMIKINFHGMKDQFFCKIEPKRDHEEFNLSTFSCQMSSGNKMDLRVMFGILLESVKPSVVLRNDVTWEDAQEEEAEEDVAEEEDAQKDVHKKMKQRRSNEELLRRWTDDTECIHVNNSDCEWVRSAVFAGKGDQINKKGYEIRSTSFKRRTILEEFIDNQKINTNQSRESAPGSASFEKFCSLDKV
eukprot:gene5833-11143_t